MAWRDARRERSRAWCWGSLAAALVATVAVVPPQASAQRTSRDDPHGRLDAEIRGDDGPKDLSLSNPCSSSGVGCSVGRRTQELRRCGHSLSQYPLLSIVVRTAYEYLFFTLASEVRTVCETPANAVEGELCARAGVIVGSRCYDASGIG
jgi:hypothetical protein